MFDRGDADYMGPAYADAADHMLLNVPTGRMGAFSADPEHFLKWVQQKGIRADRWGFLPRQHLARWYRPDDHRPRDNAPHARA
jgi:uncharacterized NAD(P)/FAD-binding protein YdhS